MSSSQNIYVAVIDDDETASRSLSRLLRGAHFQAITYSSAEGFLTDTKKQTFDCLVIDIQLIGRSGPNLFWRFAAIKDRSPVIFITGGDDPAARALAESYDSAGYFRKTDSWAEVLAIIRQAIGMEDSNSDRQTGENHQVW